MGLAERKRITYDFSNTKSQDNPIEKIEAVVEKIEEFVSVIDTGHSKRLEMSLETIQSSATIVLEDIKKDLFALVIERTLEPIDYAFDDLDQYPQVDFAKINLLVATLHDDVARFLNERRNDRDQQSADTLNEKAERYRQTAAQISSAPAVQHHKNAVA